MKKQRYGLALVLFVLLVSAVMGSFGAIANAEKAENSLIVWTDPQYNAESYSENLCVLRPSIILREAKNSSAKGTKITFGTKLQLINYEGEWCKVRTVKDDQTGYVKTGYIGNVLLKIKLEGASLSPYPGMNDSHFASAVGGERSGEIGLVLFEQGDFFYVVSEEGCTGWIHRYDEGVYYD